ncbi:MAG: hypothetical protein ABIJ56_21545 [Pseudomonadota bacterium]
MASHTVVTRTKRRGKRVGGGKTRKKNIRNHGTTPPLSINPDEESDEDRNRRDEMMRWR